LEFLLASTNLAPAAFGTLTGGVQSHNTLVAGGGYYGYYNVPVPSAANFATNMLLTATQPVNVWFSTNVPPTAGGPGDVLLMGGVTGGSTTLSTITTPAIVPGSTYYLVIQNTNRTAVSFDVKVNFDVTGLFTKLNLSAKAAASNGRPQLQWQTTRGSRYKVQWSDTIASPVWHTINTPTVTATNGVSTFIDNGAQTAPLGPQRYYRLLRVP
jgi:hypothetical protein